MDPVFEVLNLHDECLPIKSLSELKSWKNLDSNKHISYPLQKRASVTNSPKTLVCHDMKGGYLEDRFLNGSEMDDSYFFIHWSMVDIFVYFSHHLVTVPPCGWISAAHRNGVKMLGTFITEWDAGAEVCDSILSDMGSVHEICLQLVNIAKSYQFDGWLINIENKLKPDKVPLLEEFVRFLTVKMHKSQEDSLVIWYDSVITSGELKWQNELNEHNRNFFDLCDGIFLNYNWNREKLENSVKEASSRKMDVFVGVDVFGRGCLGGGGFSTDIAVRAARDLDMSVAIFAPGWVYECLDVKCFKENQYKFWNSLAELCSPRVIESFPFHSSFCPGFGKKLFRNGKVMHSRPWYNMSLQQPQPSFHSTDHPHGGTSNLCTEDAFNGGGCLQLISETSGHGKYSEFGILKTHFLVETACCVSYTFKCVDEGVRVALVLGVSSGEKRYEISFTDRPDEEVAGSTSSVCLSCCGTSNVLPTSTRVIGGAGGKGHWIKRKYKASCHATESCVVERASVRISWEESTTPPVSVLLGELIVSPASDDVSLSYTDLVVAQDRASLTMECLLQWTRDRRVAFSDLFCRVDGDERYLCTTSQFCYRFRGRFARPASTVEFVLRPKRPGKTPQPAALKIPLAWAEDSAE